MTKHTPQTTFDACDTPGLFAPVYAWLSARRYGLHGASFVAGASLSYAFAPHNIFLGLLLAFPFWMGIFPYLKDRAQAFAVGWWGGFGFFALGLNWVGYSFTQQDQVPAFLAPLAVLVMTSVLALFIAAVFAGVHHIQAPAIKRVHVFAVVWTLFEIIRGYVLTGFPWALVGAAWADYAVMTQTAFYITTYGLGALTILASGYLFTGIFLHGGRRQALISTGIGLGLYGLVLITGIVRLDANPATYHDDFTIKVIQANVQQREKWISYLIPDHFDKHMKLSRSNNGTGKAEGIDLLVWPETAVQQENFDREGNLLRWRISRLLEPGNFAIVGAPRFTVGEKRVEYFNSLFMLDHSGKLYARYDKSHLVPFGEYLPLQGLWDALGIQQLVGGAPFRPGTGPQTIRVPGVPAFSPLICYEAIFPGHVIDTDNRPQWMVNISNDGWFGMTDGPHQHMAMARMRAVEEGLPLLRSTSTGITSMMDGLGRTVKSLPVGVMGAMTVSLPKPVAGPFVPALYKVWGLSVLLLIYVAYSIINRKK